MNFSLIVPLWNEEKNIDKLVEGFVESGLPNSGMKEMILVNNGSIDNTGNLVEKYSKIYDWIKPLHLKKNENYGGGIYEGIKVSNTDIICYIPGDNQVNPDDVKKVYNKFKLLVDKNKMLMVKGNRTVRLDPYQTRFISHIYTFLANLILGLKVKDVNGLPKIFFKQIVDAIPRERMKTFVFDSQLLSLARVHGWHIEEIPVTFYSRREGVSSWSKNKLKVYFTVFYQLWKLRSLRFKPGVKLEDI